MIFKKDKTTLDTEQKPLSETEQTPVSETEHTPLQQTESTPSNSLREEEVIVREGSAGPKNSMQYNAQDLDQHQRVDVSPVHNVHIFVGGGKEDFAGRIAGTVVVAKTMKVAPGADIALFIGRDTTRPVLTTAADERGAFSINDLPPGFYSLLAGQGSLRDRSDVFKVMPCQCVQQTLMLK